MRFYSVTTCVTLFAASVVALGAGAADRPAAPTTQVLATTVTLSVRDCGAKGDGATDDSSAFQKAFEKAAEADHAVVRIPAGSYRLDHQVDVSFAGDVDNGLSVIGDGQGVTVIHCNNSKGAIRIRSELSKTHITIRDLTLVAAIPDAGTALEVSSSIRGVRNYRTLTVQNVDMRGEDLPTRKFFSRGLLALAQWRPIFQNVIFGGVLDPKLKESDPANDVIHFRPEFGFAADWSYAPTFQNCYAWACDTGYRIVSREPRQERPEDGAFYRCTAVGTRVGIDIDTVAVLPQLVIDACHLNCREAGVRLRNRKFFHITNCLFYCETPDRHPYTDIKLENCWAGVISSNIFHAPTVENTHEDPPSQRTCIGIDAGCKQLLLMANLFNGKGSAVSVAEGAKDISSANSQYLNPLTTGRRP